MTREELAMVNVLGDVLKLRTQLDRAEAERDALKAENERLWAALNARRAPSPAAPFPPIDGLPCTTDGRTP